MAAFTPNREGAGKWAFGNVFAAGHRKTLSGTFAFDSSYPTGGESIADITGAFKSCKGMVFQPTAGYYFVPDITNSKVLVYKDSKRLTAAVNPGSLLTDAAEDLAVTVTGAATTDDVLVIPPADLETGLVYQGATVTGANTVTVRVMNTSAGTIDGASKTATFILRPKSGAMAEVANTFDLSALTSVPVLAWGN